MNIRNALTFTLAANLIAAIHLNWTVINKALVIANALTLLFFVARKTITKED